MNLTPSVGSVWQEHDSRCALRTVRVVAIVGDRVSIETLTGMDGKPLPNPRKTSVKRDAFSKRFDPMTV